MDISPPPYQGLSKKLSGYIEPTLSKNIRIDPVALTAWGDKLEQGEKDFIPIKARLDALNAAMDDDDWCPPRVIDGELHHLNNVLSGYHCAKYLNETLQTLQDAEADLATWRTLSQAARAERWEQWERERVEAKEFRKKKAKISAQQNAFYSAFFALGLSPIPMAAEEIPESARALNEIERKISNMGNHLYE